MKAIQTRYYGPTDNLGARIIAKAEGVKSLSIPYPHELSGYEVHAEAALALCKKLKWSGTLVAGTLPSGDNVFVFVDSDHFAIPRD